MEFKSFISLVFFDDLDDLDEIDDIEDISIGEKFYNLIKYAPYIVSNLNDETI